MVTIGTDLATSERAVALAAEEPDVWASVGIHPHDAAGADEAALAGLERLAQVPRVVAVGEMGLDFFRDLSPREVQASVFRRQLDLARRAARPAIVHCRDAHAETLAILAEMRAGEIGGVMHCFSGVVPADRLVLETDCPFLPPEGHRGRRNEPAYLAITAARVASLRGEPLDRLAAATSESARALFRLPPGATSSSSAR
jgi:TatD DNase family protein